MVQKLIHKRLRSFLHQRPLHICLFSFSQPRNKSRNHALISITEKTRKDPDKGKFACGVFFDFQKAFDTVSHEILLAKLHHYGVRGVPLNWFKSYLENCTQFTEVNNIPSQILSTKIGVP